MRQNNSQHFSLDLQYFSRKILDTTKVEINRAIEAVKEVEKIDILIKTILDIASPTNLLSLNASIEAQEYELFYKDLMIIKLRQN